MYGFNINNVISASNNCFARRITSIHFICFDRNHRQVTILSANNIICYICCMPLDFSTNGVG